MAVIHDYGCAVCNLITYDQPTSSPPSCPEHGLMEIRYLPKAHRPFASFTFDADGQTIEVTSLHQLRQIEESSVAAWKRGEGRPFLFRHYNQDERGNNRDKNLFQELHPQVRRDQLRTRSTRGVPFVGATRSRDGLSEED